MTTKSGSDAEDSDATGRNGMGWDGSAIDAAREAGTALSLSLSLYIFLAGKSRPRFD